MSSRSSEGTLVRNLSTITNALQADVAVSVKCIYVFLYPWLETNSCPLKVYDGVLRMEYDHLPSVR